MRTVIETDPGVLELNFMWLPTWIGMNSALKQEIEQMLSARIVGKTMTEDVLDEAHAIVAGFLVGKFPEVPNLHLFLDGLKHI